MKPSKRLGQHLVPDLLSLLGRHVPVPEQGIWAGQSLSSAIEEVLGTVERGVFNDFDVFMPASKEQEDFLKSQAHLQSEALRLGLPVAGLDEYRCLAMQTSTEINMLGSTEDGLLNWVWCKAPENKENLSATKVLYSFDLNAVEVALDLKSRRLHWSKGFAFFLDTRQLEVTSCATPFRTGLRFLKKKAELKAWGDERFALDLLASYQAWAETPKTQSPQLSQKFRDLAWAYRDETQEVFTFDEATGRMSLAEQWSYPEGMEERISMLSNDLTETEGLSRLLPFKAYQDRLEPPQKAEEEVKAFGALCDLDMSLVQDGMANAVQCSVAWLGWSYLQGERSNKHLKVIEKALDDHPGLSACLIGLSLQEQYDVVKELRTRAKKEGPHIWGLAESEALPVDMWNAEHRELFFERMRLTEEQDVLAEPLFPAQEIDGYVIQELLTTRALRVEGACMDHCVGGYSSALRSGRSRILSVKKGQTPALWSTVELRMDSTSKTFIVQQHYGKKNQNPHTENRKVLKDYLDAQAEATGWKLASTSRKDPLAELAEILAD